MQGFPLSIELGGSSNQSVQPPTTENGGTIIIKARRPSTLLTIAKRRVSKERPICLVSLVVIVHLYSASTLVTHLSVIESQ